MALRSGREWSRDHDLGLRRGRAHGFDVFVVAAQVQAPTRGRADDRDRLEPEVPAPREVAHRLRPPNRLGGRRVAPVEASEATLDAAEIGGGGTHRDERDEESDEREDVEGWHAAPPCAIDPQFIAFPRRNA
jgi:hypothetical protein